MASVPLEPKVLLSHADFVRRLARSLLVDVHAAEDVAQQAMVAALESPPASSSSLRAWFGRLTRNFAFQRMRSEGRRLAREREVSRAESLPAADEIRELELSRDRLVSALLALPEPHRDAIVLRYYEDLRPGAIAQRLGIPVETVRTRIKRGLAKLRADLDGSYEELDWRRSLVALAAPSGAKTAAASSTAATAIAIAALPVAATVIALLAWRMHVLRLTEREKLQAALQDVAFARFHAQELSVQPDTALSGIREEASERASGEPAATELIARSDPTRHEAAAGKERTASLLARFVGPVRQELELGPGRLLLSGQDGSRREEAFLGGTSVLLSGLPVQSYRVVVDALPFRHREQVLDLVPRSGEEPSFDERLVLWPEGWVAVVVLTPDGRSFEELADDLGLERKRVLVDAFDVRTSINPPGEDAWIAGAEALPAKWSPPPTYQSWTLPGSCIGSLELLHPPPFWVGLAVHGKPLGWELLGQGESEVVFRLDAATFAERFASLALRVVDRPSGVARPDATVTLKADTAAHRRSEHADVPSGADGGVLLERLVPGRYGLSISAGSAGEALHQQWIELAPGEERDLGEIALADGHAVPLQVVDPKGQPVAAWIEIAPYRRNARLDELYHPNLDRHTEDDGTYQLPLPSGPSIVRATAGRGYRSDSRSQSILIDPERAPSTLSLVVREQVEVSFEVNLESGAVLEILDALDLIVERLSTEDHASLEADLLPGRYRARMLDASGGMLGETAFEILDAPLTVVLP